GAGLADGAGERAAAGRAGGRAGPGGADAAGRAVAVADAQRQRIALVVEDAPDIRLLLCDTLRQAGFEPVGAGTGASALEQARRRAPDLVTLDLSLPDMDGIEVCRQLRGMTNAYIVMLTARAEETDRLIGLEVGADDYLGKPF